MIFKGAIIAAALLTAAMLQISSSTFSAASAQTARPSAAVPNQPDHVPGGASRAPGNAGPAVGQQRGRIPGLIIVPPSPRGAPPVDSVPDAQNKAMPLPRRGSADPTPPPSGRDGFAQNRGEPIIPKYAAARAAQRAVPGKLLDVRLSKRGAPVYLVKVRDDAQIRIVVVDARTGQVLGY